MAAKRPQCSSMVWRRAQGAGGPVSFPYPREGTQQELVASQQQGVSVEQGGAEGGGARRRARRQDRQVLQGPRNSGVKCQCLGLDVGRDAVRHLVQGHRVKQYYRGLMKISQKGHV